MRSPIVVLSTLCLTLAMAAGCRPAVDRDPVAYDVCVRQGSTPESICRCFAEKVLSEYSADELRTMNKFFTAKLDSLGNDTPAAPPTTPNLALRLTKVATACHMEQ